MSCAGEDEAVTSMGNTWAPPVNQQAVVYRLAGSIVLADRVYTKQ